MNPFKKCVKLIYVQNLNIFAGVMELADVTDSKSVGSNTVWVRVPPPAPNTEAPVGCLCVWLSRTGLEAGKQNGPVERFARPGSENSPGAQHGVQAKDDLSGESHHRHQTQRHPLGASVFGYVERDSKPGETKRSCGAFCPAGERKQSGRAARSAGSGMQIFVQHTLYAIY